MPRTVCGIDPRLATERELEAGVTLEIFVEPKGAADGAWPKPPVDLVRVRRPNALVCWRKAKAAATPASQRFRMATGVLCAIPTLQAL